MIQDPKSVEMASYFNNSKSRWVTTSDCLSLREDNFLTTSVRSSENILCKRKKLERGRGFDKWWGNSAKLNSSLPDLLVICISSTSPDLFTASPDKTSAGLRLTPLPSVNGKSTDTMSAFWIAIIGSLQQFVPAVVLWAKPVFCQRCFAKSSLCKDSFTCGFLLLLRGFKRLGDQGGDFFSAGFVGTSPIAGSGFGHFYSNTFHKTLCLLLKDIQLKGMTKQIS